MAPLQSQFDEALENIEINKDKADHAIKAHTEIRAALENDEQLRKWGVDTKLIGSYSRDAGIYPGKDVDVFVKLTALDTEATPKDVYNVVWQVLEKKYGDAKEGGRALQQARSVKVAFPNEGSSGVADSSFSVDAVPAVKDGERWAIPTKDRNRWTASTGRWMTTDPERFGELSSALSTSVWSPAVGGRNAYKPIVKLMRQARRTHLGDKRPGGLFVEFATYEAWNSGRVAGDEWGPLLAQTLRRVAERFANAAISPLRDPALGTPVEPAVAEKDLANAATIFSGLADKAEAALLSDDGEAAVKWREILGGNERSASVFPLPHGYDATGKRVAASDSKEAFASVLRAGTPPFGVSSGTLSLDHSGAAKLKSTRAYGHERT